MSHSKAPDDQLYRVRHSAAHVMAQAVLELYPAAQLAIGPPIADGFYYDFDLGPDADGRPRTFLPEDLPAIERRMRRIIGGRHPFRYREVSPQEARTLFAEQPYKLELIAGLEAGEADEYGGDAAAPSVISTYAQDSFEDLCRGPHVEHTGQIPAAGLKLMSVAGAYWRGDEQRPMLQRIYGTAWLNKQQLQQHLTRLEAARKRDHRRLGRELEIFLFDDEVGPGLPLWQPNGARLIHAQQVSVDLLADVRGHPFADLGDEIETAGRRRRQDRDDPQQQLEALAHEGAVLFRESGLQYLPGGHRKHEGSPGRGEQGQDREGQQQRVGAEVPDQALQGAHVPARGPGIGGIGWRLHGDAGPVDGACGAPGFPGRRSTRKRAPPACGGARPRLRGRVARR